MGQAKLVIDYYKPNIQAWGSKCFTAQPEVLNILAALAFLIGYTKADVYPPRKTMLKWPQLKEFVSEDGKMTDDFFAKVDKTSLDIGRKGLAEEQKLKSIQSLMPPDFDAEKAKAIDPAFEVLWLFLSAAVDYRVSVLKQAQVEYERKKKAEEVEQAFEEPELITLDDDFEGLTA